MMIAPRMKTAAVRTSMPEMARTCARRLLGGAVERGRGEGADERSRLHRRHFTLAQRQAYRVAFGRIGRLRYEGELWHWKSGRFGDEEWEAFNRVPGIVFGNHTGKPFDPALPQNQVVRPEWTLAAFEDGEVATTYGAYPFTQRLNGGKARAAGVTFVGTLPQFRRRGHLRKIMEFDFKRRYEERKEPVAILLASMASIYQRYGYACISTSVRFDIDPKLDQLRADTGEGDGHVA